MGTNKAPIGDIVVQEIMMEFRYMHSHAERWNEEENCKSIIAKDELNVY